jgi:hypothetical protein
VRTGLIERLPYKPTARKSSTCQEYQPSSADTCACKLSLEHTGNETEARKTCETKPDSLSGGRHESAGAVGTSADGSKRRQQAPEATACPRALPGADRKDACKGSQIMSNLQGKALKMAEQARSCVSDEEARASSGARDAIKVYIAVNKCTGQVLEDAGKKTTDDNVTVVAEPPSHERAPSKRRVKTKGTSRHSHRSSSAQDKDMLKESQVLNEDDIRQSVVENAEQVVDQGTHVLSMAQAALSRAATRRSTVRSTPSAQRARSALSDKAGRARSPLARSRSQTARAMFCVNGEKMVSDSKQTAWLQEYTHSKLTAPAMRDLSHSPARALASGEHPHSPVRSSLPVERSNSPVRAFLAAELAHGPARAMVSGDLSHRPARVSTASTPCLEKPRTASVIVLSEYAESRDVNTGATTLKVCSRKCIFKSTKIDYGAFSRTSSRVLVY